MPIEHARPSRRAVLRALAAGSAALVVGVGAEPGSARASQEEVPPVWVPADVGEDEAWVAVNLAHQRAVGMLGSGWTRVARVTTGRPGWDTPEGQFRIVRRVYNETMTSAALGITDPNDQYVLTDVLYTQYFTWAGHALHLNYWRPDRVFGNEATSHGCVGMRLADAEYFWRFLGMGARVIIHS